MIGHPHVQELMGDHEVLKASLLVNEPHLRRIFWTRITLGLTRSFTAQASVHRLSSCVGYNELRTVATYRNKVAMIRSTSLVRSSLPSASSGL
jgi:hypothetical protein